MGLCTFNNNSVFYIYSYSYYIHIHIQQTRLLDLYDASNYYCNNIVNNN